MFDDFKQYFQIMCTIPFRTSSPIIVFLVVIEDITTLTLPAVTVYLGRRRRIQTTQPVMQNPELAGP